MMLGMTRTLYARLKDKRVEPCSLKEFTEYFEEDLRKNGMNDRVIARTHVGNRMVSTVFLGIDHGFPGNPLWFETMVFPEMDMVAKYEDYDSAMKGHDEAVDELKGKTSI